MGSACCVAARDTTLSNGSGNGDSQGNTLCSPPGRLRWDNYRRVLAEMENPACRSRERMSTDVRMEMKHGAGSERGNISNRSSAQENLGTPISQKSPSHEGISTNYMSPSEFFVPACSMLMSSHCCKSLIHELCLRGLAWCYSVVIGYGPCETKDKS